MVDKSKTKTSGNKDGSQVTGQFSQQKFTIPQDVKDKYSDLVELILKSPSMNDEERQYWFSILPIMTQDQVERLRNILITENKKLAAIDQKYQKQLGNINEKHLVEWQSIKTKKKREKIKVAERQIKEQDAKAQENLLQQLEDI